MAHARSRQTAHVLTESCIQIATPFNWVHPMCFHVNLEMKSTIVPLLVACDGGGSYLRMTRYTEDIRQLCDNRTDLHAA